MTIAESMLISKIEFLVNTRPHGSFFALVTRTSPKMTKKSRATKMPWGGEAVTIVSKFMAKLGISYQDTMRAHLLAEGDEVAAENFVAHKPRGMHHLNPWLLQNDKDSNRLYLAVDRVSDCKSVVMVGEREATPEEVADLRENFFNKPSEKTDNHGVTWRTYGLNGIVDIQ